jgi:hypothetical protein
VELEKPKEKKVKKNVMPVVVLVKTNVTIVMEMVE